MAEKQEGYNVPAIQAPQMVMTTQDYAERRKAFDEFVGSQMKQDIDYGTIPGTKKPTLYKPGAEKIARMYGVRPKFTVEWQEADPMTGYLAIKYRCQLVLVGTDRVMAEGLGLCSSFEKKYRYRKQWWNNPGAPPDAQNWERTKGKKYFRSVPNPDLVDTWNTVDKMSQKRSMVAASLCISGASERFTQDMEDFIDRDRDASPQRKQKKDAPHWTITQSWVKFWTYYKSDKGLTEDDVHKAAGVDSMKKFTGTKAELQAKVDAYIEAKIEAQEVADSNVDAPTGAAQFDAAPQEQLGGLGFGKGDA